MFSTRLVSPCGPFGSAAPDRRNRADPVKILDLIQRIRAASGEISPASSQPRQTPATKAG